MKENAAYQERFGKTLILFCMTAVLMACAKSGESFSQDESEAVVQSQEARDEADAAGEIAQAEDAGDEADAVNGNAQAEDAGDEADAVNGNAQAEDAGDEADAMNGNAQAEDAGDEADAVNGNIQAEDAGDEADPADETAREDTPMSSDSSQRAAESSNVSGTTPYGEHGALSLNGTQLVDASGAPYQLRGVSTHGLAWFPQYANKEAFRTMRDVWGVNVVRLAMYTGESGGYCTGDDNHRKYLKNLVYDSVDAATELGMYVIVDWHVLNDRDPNLYIDQAVGFFGETAQRYAAYDNVIYEICNEPNGGVSWQSIKSYAEQVIPVIRERDANAVIIVGTPTWSQDVDQAAADPIAGYSNIMYALHFYADTHRDGLRQKMISAIDAGLPVFVSEFGICDASGNGAVNREQADIWVDTMDRYGVSYCIWSLSNKAETASLLRSTTSAASGWSYEELSDCGKWFVDMMGADHAAFGAGQPAQGAGSTDIAQGANSPDAAQGAGSTDIAQGANSTDMSQGGPDGGNGAQNEENHGAADNVPVTSDASGQLQAFLVLTNSWETNGKQYSQYALALSNRSENRAESWSCEISFGGNVSVSQSWCGIFSLSGTKLTITPESYNAVLTGGASVENIGFIIEADTAVTVTGIVCR